MQQRQRMPENAIASPPHLCAVTLQRFSIYLLVSLPPMLPESPSEDSALQNSPESWLWLCCTSGFGGVFLKSVLAHAPTNPPGQKTGAKEKKSPSA